MCHNAPQEQVDSVGIQLIIAGHAPAPCRRYQHRVHAEITRDRRATDSRVPGRSRHDDVELTRVIDGLSPLLFAWCASGTRIDEVQLLLTRSFPRPDDDSPTPPDEPRYCFTLSDVILTSAFSSSDPAEPEGPPLETLTLSYGRIAWTWLGGEEPITTTWNVSEGRP